MNLKIENHKNNLGTNGKEKEAILNNGIIRNIIKLGSSYAITFPREFILSFTENNNEDTLKSMKVYIYKLDNNSLIVRKNQIESEEQTLQININDLTIELLEEILNSAKKLNIQQVKILYKEEDYERCLEIVNKFGAPVHSNNTMTLDLSRDYRTFNFRDQINGMLKNFSKIIENIITPSNKNAKETQRLINTYMKSIETSFQEALRILIFKLRYYYIWRQEEDYNASGMSNIVNILGNRVLLSILMDISLGAAGLVYSKDTPEIKKYLLIIKEFPNIVKEGIDLMLSSNIKDLLDNVYQYELKIENLKKEYQKIVPDDINKFSVNEKVITSMIEFVFNNLKEIFNIILTRWIENNVKVA
ncbi:MAG: hypothetical protein ACTSRZ_21395 [Promethearchaeota archaeon]